MRVALDAGWSIELVGAWTPARPGDGVSTWRAPGRTMLAARCVWRCADAADIIASLDSELPPNPAGKVGEGGSDGIGVRAAWLYRDTAEARHTLCGYTFTDGDCLETILAGADTDDPAWAFEAWRSVTRSGPGR
ncbi:hypothetical protein EV384_1545 [Micromonospora kangleipakensis]|uniref:Uncharacterized protein n=1 Tax=Micromonospora kangleipakensis TaxID=1077942 RepID=A0A4V6MGR7_9ACTN|nr:hypothetical protein [Micromonospora kangleipakensis]RZU73146.1 hypothetical protein EV384_1545 [Micromonospora kangleipakensis]